MQRKVVKMLYNDIQHPGYCQIRWNARDYKNESAPAGLYFYKVESENNVRTVKMILLK